MADSTFHFDVGNTLGAIFIGNIVVAIFYGVTSVQTFIYYKRNEGDSWILKHLVFCLWILDGLHLAFITYAVYVYAVRDFGNVLAMITPTWGLMAQVVATGFSDVIIRGIFCHRVWRLSSRTAMNWAVITIIIASSLLAFVMSLVFSVKLYTVDTYFELSKIPWVIYVGLAACVVADVFIAGALCYQLAMRRTRFQRNNSVIRTLMLYSINTGLFTSMCELGCLITYAASPTNFIFMGFYFVLTKLFLNSLLATLNARQSLRQAMTGEVVTIPLSHTPGTAATVSGSEGDRDADIYDVSRIHVHATTEIKTDSILERAYT
ncbi:uncharacterized protein LAESUDRAFT_704354 [Laetiporus sulphureus 93-53]|uniref:DUF6534 domain-containing protein n=1 Tax=Laetiporus sulphureus 93-53 TaxID=1314785 RepID=A0A165CXU6_9APHY|nr:uncharacterized protein LAESUDRAFT_704354 [Laetiporus sulphureus 93-53]KZT03696.1 hypothetical protein LAESUDRAFT_704354 [Laetiporus sulphureus 93-53]